MTQAGMEERTESGWRRRRIRHFLRVWGGVGKVGDAGAVISIAMPKN